MFASVDIHGRLFINTINKVTLFYTSNKMVIFDPLKNPNDLGRMFPVLAPRFYSPAFPQGLINDSETIMAIGSSREV